MTKTKKFFHPVENIGKSLDFRAFVTFNGIQKSIFHLVDHPFSLHCIPERSEKRQAHQGTDGFFGHFILQYRQRRQLLPQTRRPFSSAVIFPMGQIRAKPTGPARFYYMSSSYIIRSCHGSNLNRFKNFNY